MITVLVALSCAHPSEYGYDKNYGSNYGGDLNFFEFRSNIFCANRLILQFFLGQGYVDYNAPRYGSGYDKYVYGYYDGHSVMNSMCLNLKKILAYVIFIFA